MLWKGGCLCSCNEEQRSQHCTQAPVPAVPVAHPSPDGHLKHITEYRNDHLIPKLLLGTAWPRRSTPLASGGFVCRLQGREEASGRLPRPAPSGPRTGEEPSPPPLYGGLAAACRNVGATRQCSDNSASGLCSLLVSGWFPNPKLNPPCVV